MKLASFAAILVAFCSAVSLAMQRQSESDEAAPLLELEEKGEVPASQPIGEDEAIPVDVLPLDTPLPEETPPDAALLDERPADAASPQIALPDEPGPEPAHPDLALPDDLPGDDSASFDPSLPHPEGHIEHPDVASQLPDDSTLFSPPANYLVGKNIIVSVVEEGHAISGYSKALGKWTRQKIQPPATSPCRPVLGGQVAGLHVGPRIYGFSATTGRWDVLQVAADDKMPLMYVHADMILVEDGDNVHTFGDATGRWSSRDEPTPKQQTPIVEALRLRRVDARMVGETLQKILPDGEAVIRIEVPSNTLLMRGTPDRLNAIKELVIKMGELDSAQAAQPPVHVKGDTSLFPAADDTPKPSVDSLKRDFARHEQRAADLASQWRGLRSRGRRYPQRQKPLKDALHQEVAAAFAARQGLQRAELTELRERLSRIEQRIDARERIRQQVIQRRVEELLNPTVSWPQPGPSQPTPQSDTTVANPAVPHAFPVLGGGTGEEEFAMLRMATQMRERIAKSREEVHSYEQILKHHPDDYDDLGGTTKRLQTSRRHLEAVQDELTAQIRLVELQVKRAQAAADVAERQHAALDAHYRKGRIGSAEVAAAKLDVEDARLRVERLKTVLEHLQKAASKHTSQTDDAADASAQWHPTAPSDTIDTSNPLLPELPADRSVVDPTESRP